MAALRRPWEFVGTDGNKWTVVRRLQPPYTLSALPSTSINVSMGRLRASGCTPANMAVVYSFAQKAARLNDVPSLLLAMAGIRDKFTPDTALKRALIWMLEDKPCAAVASFLSEPILMSVRTPSKKERRRGPVTWHTDVLGSIVAHLVAMPTLRVASDVCYLSAVSLYTSVHSKGGGSMKPNELTIPTDEGLRRLVFDLVAASRAPEAVTQQLIGHIVALADWTVLRLLSSWAPRAVYALVQDTVLAALTAAQEDVTLMTQVLIFQRSALERLCDGLGSSHRPEKFTWRLPFFHVYVALAERSEVERLRGHVHPRSAEVTEEEVYRAEDCLKRLPDALSPPSTVGRGFEPVNITLYPHVVDKHVLGGGSNSKNKKPRKIPTAVDEEGGESEGEGEDRTSAEFFFRGTEEAAQLTRNDALVTDLERALHGASIAQFQAFRTSSSTLLKLVINALVRDSGDGDDVEDTTPKRNGAVAGGDKDEAVMIIPPTLVVCEAVNPIEKMNMPVSAATTLHSPPTSIDYVAGEEGKSGQRKRKRSSESESELVSTTSTSTVECPKQKKATLAKGTGVAPPTYVAPTSVDGKVVSAAWLTQQPTAAPENTAWIVELVSAVGVLERNSRLWCKRVKNGRTEVQMLFDALKPSMGLTPLHMRLGRDEKGTVLLSAPAFPCRAPTGVLPMVYNKQRVLIIDRWEAGFPSLCEVLKRQSEVQGLSNFRSRILSIFIARAICWIGDTSQSNISVLLDASGNIKDVVSIDEMQSGRSPTNNATLEVGRTIEDPWLLLHRNAERGVSADMRRLMNPAFSSISWSTWQVAIDSWKSNETVRPLIEKYIYGGLAGVQARLDILRTSVQHYISKHVTVHSNARHVASF